MASVVLVSKGEDKEEVVTMTELKELVSSLPKEDYSIHARFKRLNFVALDTEDSKVFSATG